MRPPAGPPPGRARGVARRLLALAAVLAAAAAPAQGQRSLVIDSLHSEVRVLPDGDLLVTETLRPRFTGSWNGVLRNLSLRPPADYGGGYSLQTVLVSATDDAGRPLRSETRTPRQGVRQFRIWVPDARDRTATVVLTYRVGNALGFFEADSASGTGAWDELYWQATGTEWEVPIRTATARVHLPPGASAIQSAAYLGGAASTRRAEVRQEGAGTAVAAGPVGPLPPGSGLTIAVGWPAGSVARPAPGTRTHGDSAPFSPLALWPLLIPLGVFALSYRAWSRRGRDPSELAIATRWDPPADLSPAEAGTLIDHSAGLHDVVSTLIDLAVKGFLSIEEREKRGFLAVGKDYAFHCMRPERDRAGLPEHERLFLEGLFDRAPRQELALAGIPLVGALLDRIATSDDAAPPPGALATVRLSELQNEFYKRIPAITDALQRTLVAKGLYVERPDRVRTRWMLFGVAAAGAGLLGGMPLAVAGPTSSAVAGGLLVVAGFVSAGILSGFAMVMPARTEKGARTREAVLGFKRFLERVESPRYRRMITSPDVFERYLPFAVAFRCEERWARAFEDLVTEPPDWYRGTTPGTFRPSTFVRDVGTLSAAARSTLASSPSSSGSGGGGSVGGGGGGGGGGGF